ncbi:MAG: hypothetical protein KF722_05735 [Nitrospira sp.]|nr:hypothetical protein [Nitrospira sp.]
MKELRDHLARRMAYAWLSHFSGDANPSKLFEGVKFRLDIPLGKKGSDFQLWSSKYLKWFAAERPNLFTSIEFCKIEKQMWHLNRFPKIGNMLSLSSFAKLLQRSPVGLQLTTSGPTIYVHRVITMFIKCFDFVPYFRNETDGVKKSEDYKPFHFGVGSKSRAALAGFNSSAFFFYFVALGDCFHCGREFVLSFPLGLEALPDATGAKLEKISLELMSDLRRNALRRRVVSEKTGDVEYDEFWPSTSKLFLDKIDRVLAKHYGFTDEELDFIINYDIKYRMGQDAGEIE